MKVDLPVLLYPPTVDALPDQLLSAGSSSSPGSNTEIICNGIAQSRPVFCLGEKASGRCQADVLVGSPRGGTPPFWLRLHELQGY